MKKLAILCSFALLTACGESPTNTDEAPQPPVEASMVDDQGSVIGFPATSPPDWIGVARSIITAGAGQSVLPAAFASVMGNSNNVYPHSYSNMRYQQVFSEAEIGGPQTFRELCLRPTNTISYDFPARVSDITLKLGPTTLDPSNLGPTFAANYSASPTTVFVGDFFMPAFSGPGTPDDWTACMHFSTPYVYLGGNLIIEMVNTTSAPAVGIWPADFCTDCNATRVYAFSSSASTAETTTRNQGLIVRLSAGIVPVTIDIKPGSDPNSINIDAENGVVAVAILTTDDFDATTVDHTTLLFEGVPEMHVDRKTGEARRHEEDVDGDGDTDLLMHVRVGDTGFDQSSTEGTVTGSTFDGSAIQGTDAVRPIWEVASVTGSGHITWQGEQRTMTFTAREFSDGSVQGEWQRYNRAQDAKAHGNVTCMSFDGNQAFLGGFTETTTGVGDGVYWAVEDNGEPGDELADRLTLQSVGLSEATVANWCAAQVSGAWYDVEEGNFTVRN